MCRHNELRRVYKVTILILIDGFLQFKIAEIANLYIPNVTILILIDGFLQFCLLEFPVCLHGVTILILIDGFLQYRKI